MIKEILDDMAAVYVHTVDVSTLTDLRDIEIDTSLPIRKSWRLLRGRRIMSMSIGLVVMLQE